MKIDIHYAGTLSMVTEMMADIVIRNGRVIKNRYGDGDPMPRNMLTVGNGHETVVLYFEHKSNLFQALQKWIEIEKTQTVDA